MPGWWCMLVPQKRVTTFEKSQSQMIMALIVEYRTQVPFVIIITVYE